MITHASTFSGIGAPEVAAEMLGWENVFHCEINPFGRKVLDYYFPKAKSYEDITRTDFSEWRDRITVLTGGFPCQPFSYAGRRRGSEDDRYLWPFMLRCIEQVRPRWFVGENVAGITTMEFPNGLMDYLRFKGILPTPQASQEKDSTKDLLPEQNQHWLLTPSATDGLRGEMSCNSLMRHKNKTEEELAKASLETQVASFVKKKIDNGSYPSTDGEPFRLSPLFTEEMMGFPFLWTTLPFLSANGSEKA